MKKFSTFITEGLSRKLYHWREWSAFVNIFNSDSLRLAIDIASASERKLRPEGSDKIYYASFSRAPRNSFITASISKFTANVILVVNGELLQARGYTGSPVEYFTNVKGRPTRRSEGSSEKEDRVFSTKDEIPKFVTGGYIEEIHIMGGRPMVLRGALLGDDKEWLSSLITKQTSPIFFDTRPTDLIVIINSLLKKGIKVYFHEDVREFSFARKPETGGKQVLDGETYIDILKEVLKASEFESTKKFSGIDARLTKPMQGSGAVSSKTSYLRAFLGLVDENSIDALNLNQNDYFYTTTLVKALMDILAIGDRPIGQYSESQVRLRILFSNYILGDFMNNKSRKYDLTRKQTKVVLDAFDRLMKKKNYLANAAEVVQDDEGHIIADKYIQAIVNPAIDAIRKKWQPLVKAAINDPESEFFKLAQKINME